MNRLNLSLLFSAFVAFAAPVHAADVAAGKALAEEACADCHGDDGKGEEDFPIAGMSAADFTKAITEYQNGTRTKDAKMVKAAKKLTPADVANLAAYYGKMAK
jgi:cytochrome c553